MRDRLVARKFSERFFVGLCYCLTFRAIGLGQFEARSSVPRKFMPAERFCLLLPRYARPESICANNRSSRYIRGISDERATRLRAVSFVSDFRGFSVNENDTLAFSGS